MPTSRTLQSTARAGMRPALCRLLAGAALCGLPMACTAEIDGGVPGASLPGASGSSSASGGDGAPGAGAPGVAPDTANTVLRRLNRSEYNNTVRDLLGTSLRPADRLPSDETVDGFDEKDDSSA